jgi:ABC-2 type transport system ATP-binding protein
VSALDGLDLVVEPGRVHGFLGPNGSGKTTTLRILLGLVSADAGSVRLFGATVPKQLSDVVARVGALVESPQFFPAFSGRLNLELLADAAGQPKSRVDETLAQVGLAERANDRVRTYSLGMRQRLGIAAALLKSPELLMLDEPTNGLDPAGMREIRDLLRTLAGSGVTILLSSHLLSEVTQVCDAVTIVARGSTVVSGLVSDVLARGTRGRRLVVGLADPHAGAAVLAEAGLEASVGDGVLYVAASDDPAMVSRLLGERGLWVSALYVEEAGLEDVFLELTGSGGPA